MADSTTSQASGHKLAIKSEVELRYDPAFSEQDANIILQSSDGILYRMSPFTLRTTSGFFRDMMTLPQRESHTSARDDDFIILDETGKVLGILLRMISGFEIPKWESLHDMELVVGAADKYDMPGPRAIIRAIMGPLAFTIEPLALYAIAARMGWEEEAKIASTGTLTLSIYADEHIHTLDRIPSHYLRRLLVLHRRRRENFQKLVDGFPTHNHPGSSMFSPTRKVQVWEDLKVRMFQEMDRRPMGDTLLGGDSDVEWPEATACWIYRCDRCGGEAFPRQSIVQKIRASLDNSLHTI